MFIADFLTMDKERLGVKVSFLDFLVYMISRKMFINRISKSLGKNFNRMYFGGVDWYVKWYAKPSINK